MMPPRFEPRSNGRRAAKRQKKRAALVRAPPAVGKRKESGGA
jgi:hypothetical protein